jgi:hypothetical protein
LNTSQNTKCRINSWNFSKWIVREGFILKHNEAGCSKYNEGALAKET